jgi:type II secretory pathway component PulK
VDSRVSYGSIERARCKWACRAGTETAIAVLAEDFADTDCLADLWADNDEDFNDILLEGCVFSVRVTDEAGKLNVNTAKREQLLALPYMTEDVVDAIMDWRDQDDEPLSEGAESGYYENLTYPYTIRNNGLRTIRELLAVKGMSFSLLYGEDTNLNGLLDYNERDGDESLPADDTDDELDRGWIAFLTCYSYELNEDAMGEARVNINQANQRTLQQSLGLSNSVARWIVQTRENRQYESIGDLISNSSPSQPEQQSGGGSNQSRPIDIQTFSDIADRITVSNEDRVLGKVNVNTAPREVLVALLGGTQQAEQTAYSLMAYRGSSAFGIESIGELLSADIVSIEEFKGIADYITTRSSVYTIHTFATAERGAETGYKLVSEVVVDRSSTPAQVLYRYQGVVN